MRTTDKQLNNLPVYTTAGTLLGYVVGFEIDVDVHAITTYFVTEHKLVPEVLRSLVGVAVFAVAPSQVVAIQLDRMIVQDTLLKTKPVKRPLFAMVSAQPVS